LHDCAEPPKEPLKHFEALFAGAQPSSLGDVAQRYAEAIRAAVQAWKEGRATDAEARWLDWLVSRGLLRNSLAENTRLAELVSEYRQVESQQVALPRVVPGLADFDAGFEQSIFVRGDCQQPADVANRGYLEVLSQPGESFTTAGSGRLELAERIASSSNPLTARVMANRIWHHLFAAGLVRSVDDFGHMGDLPSHPELLDHLATRFVEQGWSVKGLIRHIVLSRTFRMSSRPATATEADPTNRLLHHYPARRMEAEAVRDAILAASGRLDRTLYGPSIQPYREKENADRRLFAGPLDGLGRRSIYIKANLMEGPKFLGAFNFPGGKVAQGRRDVTHVPAQALALLNDPFVLGQADLWAATVVGRSHPTIQVRIAEMFETAVGRPPAESEAQAFAQFVKQLAALHLVPADQILSSQILWRDVAHAFFNLREFIYIP
jgi:hypothetical protein